MTQENPGVSDDMIESARTVLKTADSYRAIAVSRVERMFRAVHRGSWRNARLLAAEANVAILEADVCTLRAEMYLSEEW